MNAPRRLPTTLLWLTVLCVVYVLSVGPAWYLWRLPVPYYAFYAPAFALGGLNPVKPAFDWYFYGLWQAGFETTPEPGEVQPNHPTWWPK